jgi:hypothetical protein
LSGRLLKLVWTSASARRNDAQRERDEGGGEYGKCEAFHLDPPSSVTTYE